MYNLLNSRVLQFSPLKKIRPRISFNRPYFFGKVGVHLYQTLFPYPKEALVISQEKHRVNPLLSEFPLKSGTFILVSNTYAKIPWHLLTNSFLAVNAEITQGETALRSS